VFILARCGRWPLFTVSDPLPHPAHQRTGIFGVKFKKENCYKVSRFVATARLVLLQQWTSLFGTSNQTRKLKLDIRSDGADGLASLGGLSISAIFAFFLSLVATMFLVCHLRLPVSVCQN